jgi:hypothetical protein
MSRLRMEWDWVGDYPIFVYMRFVTHGVWDVKIVKGVKGNQNAGGIGPTAPAWFSYRAEGLVSRSDVCKDACKRAKWKLKAQLRMAND